MRKPLKIEYVPVAQERRAAVRRAIENRWADALAWVVVVLVVVLAVAEAVGR